MREEELYRVKGNTLLQQKNAGRASCIPLAIIPIDHKQYAYIHILKAPTHRLLVVIRWRRDARFVGEKEELGTNGSRRRCRISYKSDGFRLPFVIKFLVSVPATSVNDKPRKFGIETLLQSVKKVREVIRGVLIDVCPSVQVRCMVINYLLKLAGWSITYYSVPPVPLNIRLETYEDSSID